MDEPPVPSASGDEPVETPGAPRMRGKVKWFNATRGFGFITPDDGNEDLFVHQTSIQSEGFRSLREEEEVEFEVETAGDGRTKAVNVTGPAGATPQGAPRRTSFRGGAAPAPGMRGRGGRGRGGPGMYYTGMAYPAYPAEAAYYGGAYPAYGYYAPPPRGIPPPRGGRFIAGGGRGMFLQGVPGGQAGEPSGMQVVVHNLPFTTTWQQLKDRFKDWNPERADVIYDAIGRSRGFGTVRFTSADDAETACAKVNNTEFDGRLITVRIDRYA